MMVKVTISILFSFPVVMAYADSNLPDPTRPADYSVSYSVEQISPKKRAEFKLNAIRVSDIDRSAIVNGRLVRVGDDIGTAKVREINSQDVVLDYDRKLITIPLYAKAINKNYKTTEIKN